VRDFWRFVDETGYVTLAERPPDPATYPGADPALSWAATDLVATAQRPTALRFVHSGALDLADGERPE
jgi:formylglycine-generating enzyme